VNNENTKGVVDMQSAISASLDCADHGNDALADIRDVKINTDLPQKERVKSYIQQIKNPFQMRHQAIYKSL